VTQKEKEQRALTKDEARGIKHELSVLKTDIDAE